MKILIGSIVLASSLFAQAQSTLSGKAAKTSWGGYWWSMWGAQLALGWENDEGRERFTLSQVKNFDECLSETSKSCQKYMKELFEEKGVSLSPMMKFDLWVKGQVDAVYAPGTGKNMYSRATKNEMEIHVILDSSHPHYEASGYAGKCTGWALSNADYSEPVATKVIDGVSFSPADIKGILAGIYNGAQFFVPDAMVLGNAYRAQGPAKKAEFQKDPAPHDLILALEKHIGEEKKIIVADMDPNEGVWNHPIYQYSVKLGAAKGDKILGEMVLKYAKDEVEIDSVFSGGKKREDLTERKLTFELTVPKDWDKKMSSVKKSAWSKESADKHPDSLILGLEKGWRKSIYDYKSTDMKLEVNYQLIKKVNLGRGYKVLVDELLAKYYSP